MNSRDSDALPPVPTGAVTVSVSTASKAAASSPFAEQAPQPPTDPEAVLRSRYGGGLLPAHKKRGPSLHKGHLHQHFDSADWSMAKARGAAAAAATAGAPSTLSAAAALLPLEEVAPPRLAPEPPAPRRASHLGDREASK